MTKEVDPTEKARVIEKGNKARNHILAWLKSRGRKKLYGQFNAPIVD